MMSAGRVKSSLNNPFIALRHRNFRLYFCGMCVSTIGTWMQNIAQPWLAYSLTKSPFLLSLVGALQFTPVLLFSLFAGVIIDRLPKKNILFFTQAASLVITFLFALLTSTGQIRYWHILVLAACLGVVNTLDMPSRQSFVIELAGKDDLMNAIALNSTAFNMARIIGPSIAGVVMAAAGVSVCFFVNSVSFAAVLISLFFIHPVPPPKTARDGDRVMDNVREGLRYISGHDILLETLMVVAIVSTFAPNFSVLVPVFASKVLRQGEAGFGFLMSMLGVGSLAGSLFIAMLSRTGPKRFIQLMVPLLVGVFLIVTGCTGLYMLTGLALAVTGFFFVSFSSNANSTMQLNICEEEYRGRVMSVYTLITAGSTPLGNLFAGAVTDRFGARAGFAACGGVILLLMIPTFIFRLHKRRQEARRTSA